MTRDSGVSSWQVLERRLRLIVLTHFHFQRRTRQLARALMSESTPSDTPKPLLDLSNRLKAAHMNRTGQKAMTTWADVYETEERPEVLAVLNSREQPLLDIKGMSPVSDVVLNWRMHKAMQKRTAQSRSGQGGPHAKEGLPYPTGTPATPTEHPAANESHTDTRLPSIQAMLSTIEQSTDEDTSTERRQ